MKKMIIKNFKCFEEQEFEFKKLTILAGANGSGKSTLIQAILLLRQTAELEDYEGDYLKKIFLNGYYFKAGTSTDILYANAKEDKISFNLISNNEKYSVLFECKINKDEPRVLETNHKEFVEDEDDDDDEDYEFLPSCSYGNFDFISADRFGPKSTYEVSSERKVKVGKYGEFTPYVLNEFKKELIKDNKVYLDSTSKKSHSLLTEVNNWLSYILDGVTIDTEVLDFVNLALLKITNYPASELDFKNPINMPYGASYILPIIVSCLSKKIALYEENYNSLIIIENPEAHLHPSAQSKLGQFLAKIANSGVQIIIETHSDHIINGIRIAIKKGLIEHTDVIFNSFSKGNKLGENIIEEILINSEGKLNKWPKGFFDQYENDMMELL